MEHLECPPPTVVLVDFEQAIISSVERHFLEALIRACFFHLSQSVFRHVQSEGLQSLYNNEDDPQIRDATRQMCALAFVPVQHVKRVFGLFEAAAPQVLSPVIQYFSVSIRV